MEEKKESKLQHAMRLVEEGANPHAAAMRAGFKAAGVVYAALKKRRMASEGRCPCCGQALPK